MPANLVAAADVLLQYDPQRLVTARTLGERSQAWLAEKVGVTTQAVSQWEKHDGRRPSPEHLVAAADALGMPVGFFASRATDRQPVGTFFRSLRSTKAADRARARAFADLARVLAEGAEQYVEVDFSWKDVPRLDAPSTGEAVLLNAVAAEMRRSLGVPARGPVTDVVRVAERHGVIVLRADQPGSVLAGISAFSVPDAHRPVVVLSGDDGERARARMDAAHEIVHLLMHDPDPAHPKHIETQATQLAAAFLLPIDEFGEDITPCVAGGRFDWRGLVRLRAKWGVSIQAMLVSADRNGLLAPGKLEQAMRYINARGWRRKEPGADPKHEQPRMLRRLLELAEAQGVSTQRIAEENGIPARYLPLIVPKPLPTLTL